MLVSPRIQCPDDRTCLLPRRQWNDGNGGSSLPDSNCTWLSTLTATRAPWQKHCEQKPDSGDETEEPNDDSKRDETDGTDDNKW